MPARIHRVSTITAFLLLAALPVMAQTSDRPAESARGTELGLLVGGASASGTGAVAAGVAGWEVSRWWAVEARGSWFAPGDGSSGFGADLGAIVNVVPRQEITPYVGASFGLYRATFDSRLTPMPAFYRHRVEDNGRPERMMFTDPAFRLTAGVDILNGRNNISIRPEASSMFVWSDGRSDAMVMVGVRFGYRFEENTVR
jgi:hypothetical protein